MQKTNVDIYNMHIFFDKQPQSHVGNLKVKRCCQMTQSLTTY